MLHIAGLAADVFSWSTLDAFVVYARNNVYLCNHNNDKKQRIMAGLKSLVKDTAIYGVSSIVGRFLNYLLVPIYVPAMSARSGGYGGVTEVYAWVALLMVILTYGMETTFFRYVNKAEENPRRVYSTTLSMGGSTSRLVVAL